MERAPYNVRVCAGVTYSAWKWLNAELKPRGVFSRTDEHCLGGFWIFLCGHAVRALSLGHNSVEFERDCLSEAAEMIANTATLNIRFWSWARRERIWWDKANEAYVTKRDAWFAHLARPESGTLDLSRIISLQGHGFMDDGGDEGDRAAFYMYLEIAAIAHFLSMAAAIKQLEGTSA